MKQPFIFYDICSMRLFMKLNIKVIININKNQPDSMCVTRITDLCNSSDLATAAKLFRV